MNTLGFSIIIPCFNAGKFLVEAIDSIVNQSFRYPYEIIISDDGSRDSETLHALAHLEVRPLVKIIRSRENKGAQFARNAAIRIARFPFVFSIDADDKLNADETILRDGTYPDIAIEILASFPDIAFVHGTTLMFGDFSGLTISAYPISESLVLAKHHVQNSIVYRKEDAVGAGLYDEDIRKWQDWSFAVALLNCRFKSGKKNKIYFIDRPFYLYRIYNDHKRVSSGEIDEKSMVKITVKRSPEIFRNHYKNLSDDEIADLVFESKPSKLNDLFYIAYYNLDRAIEIAKERGTVITWKNEPPGIP